MIRLKAVLWRLRQLPVVFAWRTAIRLAPKQTRHGIVVCDVCSDESMYGDRFAGDVGRILEKLAESSPKLLQRIQRFLGHIVRAKIPNDFQYFARPKLLLLYVDYGRGGLNRRDFIKAQIVQAATLAYLRERNPDLDASDARVDRILTKQRMRILGVAE